MLVRIGGLGQPLGPCVGRPIGDQLFFGDVCPIGIDLECVIVARLDLKKKGPRYRDRIFKKGEPVTWSDEELGTKPKIARRSSHKRYARFALASARGTRTPRADRAGDSVP